MNQAEKQFIMDLQLFADGDVVTETTTTEPTATEPTATNLDSQIDYEELGTSNTTDQLAMLKKHGFFNDETTEPDQPATESEQVEEPPIEPSGEPTYKVKIDGQEQEVRLTELLSGYQRQADYTRKTQELAEQRRLAEAVLAQSKPQPQQIDPVKQTEQEYNAVVAQAERELKLNAGEFNPYDPIHQYKFSQVSNQQNTQKLVQQQLYSKAQNMWQQAQADPQSQEIAAKYDEYVYKLAAGGKEGFIKAQAITAASQRMQSGQFSEDDINILVNHWQTVKQALNAPKAPLKPKINPPKTETPGSSVAQPKTNLDLKKLGRLSNQDQLSALRETGILRQDKYKKH